MKKIFSFVLGAMVFAIGSSAYALNVRGVASATVGVTGVQSGVNAGANVNAGVGAQASATSPAQSVAASTSAQLGTGLQAQLQAVTASTSSEDAVVQLQGGTVGLIQASSDLSAYNDLVIKARPVVTAINVNSDNTVAVQYVQPAKLFGLFPASVTGEVDVDAQGNTTVHMPWWAMFYSKDTSGVQASVAAAVHQLGGAAFGQDVSAAAQAQQQARGDANANINANANASAQAQARLQEKARVISAVTAALQARLQGEANASTSANANTNANANANAQTQTQY